MASNNTLAAMQPTELSPGIKAGILTAGSLAILSILTTSIVLSLITYQFFLWRGQQQKYIRHNQCLVLVYCLLLADLQQSAAFLIGLHWYTLGAIVPETGWCFAQGWLLHIGDVSSGLFVLAIGVHTLFLVCFGKKLDYFAFCACVVAIWLLAFFLTATGPIIYGWWVFAPAGDWCWIQPALQLERLLLHYVWIFAVEFGVVLIYSAVAVYLHKKMRIMKNNADSHGSAMPRISRATRTMIMYPLAYLILTLPLATGRMMQYAGREIPDTYYVVAGCLITSCGSVDALLYTITRRILINTDPDAAANASLLEETKSLSTGYWSSSRMTPVFNSPSGMTSGEVWAGSPTDTLVNRWDDTTPGTPNTTHSLGTGRQTVIMSIPPSSRTSAVMQVPSSITNENADEKHLWAERDGIPETNYNCECRFCWAERHRSLRNPGL